MPCHDTQRALHTAEEPDTVAEVWYNVAHLALGIGDVNLAYQVRHC